MDISGADGTIAVCAKLGLKADEVRAGIGDQAIKDRTRTEVEKRSPAERSARLTSSSTASPSGARTGWIK